MVAAPVLGEWRLIMEESGGECVVVAGESVMLRWCVESWAVELLYEQHDVTQDRGHGGIVCPARGQSPHWSTVHQRHMIVIVMVLMMLE
ncbi:hypothetical protein AAFF_G00022270 [Aldrovandia affinis]|uniref:Uncharacterized protein n=1 Tax=Aldrovandia affinis TaxID=143900 RepID=A0AAD7VXF7_9TELE|nr:hypothetical protein AAFF_G00022270 [Aldrovandia affinis]